MAQAKTASAQVRKRNRPLVRSVLAMLYIAIVDTAANEAWLSVGRQSWSFIPYTICQAFQVVGLRFALKFHRLVIVTLAKDVLGVGDWSLAPKRHF